MRKCVGSSKRAVTWTACLLLAGWTSARADIGPKPIEAGRTIAPGKDLEGVAVEMAAEDVQLRLSQVEEYLDRLDVTAVFTMRNPGPAVKMETGFPAGAWKGIFESFSVKCDGKPVDFELVNRGGAAAAPEEPSVGGPAPEKPARGGQRSLKPAHAKGGADYWYVWKATYPAGESRVEVRYAVKIVRHLLSGSTGYVLHTGAAWKGPIGKAVVTLTFGKGYSADHVNSVQPWAGARMEDDRFVWELKDLEPTAKDDIHVVYSTRSGAETLAEVREEAKTGNWQGLENHVSVLAFRPSRVLRTSMTPDELEEYVDALAAIIAEGKERDGFLVFPAADPDGSRRQYLTSPGSLFGYIEKTAKTVEKYPESRRAKEVLARYVDLGARFQAGKVMVGDKVWEIRAGRFKEEFDRNLSASIEKGRKLLEKA